MDKKLHISPERLEGIALISTEHTTLNGHEFFQYLACNVDEILALFQREGVILFRGLAIATTSDFEKVARLFTQNLYQDYGDLPKQGDNDSIYHSTPYPEDDMIMYHNESSHQHHWPSKQWFCCFEVAEEGGRTPIVDCIEMAKMLPRQVIEEFEQRGLTYVRNFIPNLDVSWQDFFQTQDKDEVNEYAAKFNMQAEWKDDQTLRVLSNCPGVITHPYKQATSFFNQIQLHHPACLAPEVKEALSHITGSVANFPRYVMFGDGTPIPDKYIEIISATYESCAKRFAWQQGDVLMLDNLRYAHARDPFKGKRKISVALAEMTNFDAITNQIM